MADDGDGMLTLELQAQELTKYNGSSNCPTCGMIINPVEFLANQGHCTGCTTAKRQKRAKELMQ